ncbi:MAG: MBL fold metallo-hydrolase [Phycisphaeraceae bacterium]|nr:MAG: MBL fold metallo-hydrolase [Phycisphaeraceae bacterium]
MFMRMIYDEKLAQAAYLIGCQKTGEAIVFDPERDVDRYINLARENSLRIVAVAETHIHADFVSGARELAERTDARVYLSAEGGPDWSSQWLDKKSGGGSYNHTLLRNNDSFSIGKIEFRALHTPGHTPEHLIFVVTDHGAGADAPIGVITGDLLFVGDLGRPDLLESAAGQAGAMEPGARQLFKTLSTLERIPDFVQVWPGHGAGSACGKALGAVPMSTFGYERRFNTALHAATSEANFVQFILSGQPEPPLYFADMKRINKQGPAVLGELPDPPQLSAQKLLALDPHRHVIVDTRRWSDFRDGALDHALWLALDRSFTADAGSFIREDDQVVLIIEPSRLEEAVRDLIRIGRDRIVGWFDSAGVPELGSMTTAYTTFPEIDPEEALKLIDSGSHAILDVRRATEHAENHIPGAVNIAHTRLASRLDELPPSPMIVHCRSGIRSAKSAAFLRRAGHCVINLRGGMMAIEKIKPNPVQYAETH